MLIRTFDQDEELPYERYSSPKSPNYSMTHLINMMGDGVIYVETGVNKGVSLSSVVQVCPNIKSAYGIDFYKPNTDEFDREHRVYTEKNVKNAYQRAKHRIRSSGHKDKITLILEDISVAKDYFEDNSIDFLFLDHYLNQKDVEECLPMWYNKVKINGYFAGHDWIYRGVQSAVHDFRKQYDVQPPLSTFGGEWVWKKDRNI